MRKISFLTLLALVVLTRVSSFAADGNSTAPPSPSVRWEKDIHAFEEQDKKTPPPADAVLFIGSSSFRLWTNMAKDFSEIPVINRGFGGSEIADSTYFFDRIVKPCKPRLVVMYAGGNDLERGKTPEQVLADFQAFAAKVQGGLPGVRVVYISINPSLKRWKERDKTATANSLIADYIHGQGAMSYIDSYTPLIGADGQPQKALLREDGLHLNSEGYKVWLSIIKPPILQLYKEAKPAE